MRVVAGSLRGRPIVSPPGDNTRPTTDRARAAVFNSLHSLGAVEGATVADLFAGSGALGIEALSRGASTCIFVEHDRKALEAIRTNIDKLGLAGRARVLAGDVSSNLGSLRGLDLVLVDPPYDFDDWPSLLQRCAPCLAPDAVVVAESGRELPALAGWDVVRSKRYGRAWVSFLVRSADAATGPTGTVSPE